MLDNTLDKQQPLTRELFSDRPAIKVIAEKAHSLGYLVEAVPYDESNKRKGVRTKALLINEHCCSVHNPTKLSQDSYFGHNYSRVTFQRSTVLKTTASIIHITVDDFPEGTLIVPNGVLIAAFDLTNRAYASVSVPVEKLPTSKRGNTPRVDWWQYLDAWHLLMPPKQTPPAP